MRRIFIAQLGAADVCPFPHKIPKTAKALGHDIAPTVLAAADEVIE